MFNPFVIIGIVPDKYFCDREKETDKLLRCHHSFINVLKSLSGSFGYDALIGLPSLDIRLEDIRTSRMTLAI